jgi:hypothetical protein
MIDTLTEQRGHEAYDTTFAAMRAFTDARTATTANQLWMVEHPPVFTLGLGADSAHIIDAHDIPIVQTDRGGEVTYHGPGQAHGLAFSVQAGVRVPPSLVKRKATALGVPSTHPKARAGLSVRTTPPATLRRAFALASMT